MMAQAPKDQVNVAIVADNDQQPSTSKEESPILHKEHRKFSFLDQLGHIPSWRFGQTRRGSAASSRDVGDVEEEHKIEVPNVLRSSMVKSNIIPPLPRLSMSEEMDEKLTRMLRKLDDLMLTKPLEDESTEADNSPGATRPSKAPAPTSSKAKTE